MNVPWHSRLMLVAYLEQQGFVAFCWATLRRVRCPHGPYFTEKTGCPASPKTVGEMIRKRRLDLGLRQKDVAEIIGCDTMTVLNWEKSHTAFPRVQPHGRSGPIPRLQPHPSREHYR